jgi:hypothetical protein
MPGVFTTTVSCPSLVVGEWVAIALHHRRRQTLLGTAEHHELSVSVNGVELTHAVAAPFPRSLNAAPLVMMRLGEALAGELGPIYFWGEGCGQLSPALQDALVEAHTGSAVRLLPTSASPTFAENATSKVFAVYHPAYSLTNSHEEAANGDETVTCCCPSLLGTAPSYLNGHHGARPVSGVSVRDALQVCVAEN